MENQNEIARIAYELYLMRGGAPGDPVADWLTAERIYEEKQKSLMIRTLEEPVLVSEAVQEMVVEAPVAKDKKVRKAAAPKAEVKAVPEVKASPKKEAKKTVAPKAVAAKVEKEVEAPKPKRVVRKKATAE